MPEIFQYDFMQRAFVAGILIGMIAPMIGIFLVVRRYSLLADTLSHVSLVGVATAAMLGIHPVIGALIASAIAAVSMEKLREKRKMFGESILALFLSGSLALAVVILGLSHGLNVNIFSFLFGSITTVSSADLVLIGGFGMVVMALTILLFKQFFLASYDEDLAKANGLPMTFLNTTLMLLAAMTVSLSMRIVGILLVGALMVIPVLTAMQFGKSFLKTSVYSVVFSVVAVISGLVTSFYWNVPSGGAIVLTALLFFAMSFTARKTL